MQTIYAIIVATGITAVIYFTQNPVRHWLKKRAVYRFARKHKVGRNF
jgi:hypothetical protein